MKKAMTLSIRLSVTAILLLSIHPVLSLAQTTPMPRVPQIGPPPPPPNESPSDRKKREKREGELAKKELDQKKKYPLDISKNSLVVLKASPEVLSFEKISIWSGSYNYAADVTCSPGGTTVNGRSDWRQSGYPLPRVFVLAKFSPKPQFDEVELKADNTNIKLRFEKSCGDVAAALREVVYEGNLAAFENSDYFKREVISGVLPKVFWGPLAQIPAEKQVELARNAMLNNIGVGGENFQGKFFFFFAVRASTNVYNSIQLNQAARVANVINSEMLVAFKQVTQALNGSTGIDGVKFQVPVLYRNFVTERYLNPYTDDLQVYVPLDLITRFSNAEITSQQLIDGSVVLVNSNRVQVLLSQF